MFSALLDGYSWVAEYRVCNFLSFLFYMRCSSFWYHLDQDPMRNNSWVQTNLFKFCLKKIHPFEDGSVSTATNYMLLIYSLQIQV
jgi:hypothetical protein